MNIKSFKEWDAMHEAEELANPDSSNDSSGTYVSMKVKNKEELHDWFYTQNIDVVPEDELHCTISYSRTVFEHTPSDTTEVIITPEQLLNITPLGDEGAIVLKFNSAEMQDKFNQCMDEGATYDYDTYIPHITITINGKEVDLSNIELPIFDIILFNETTEPLDLDWKAKLED
jgi:hypothetical protein